LGQIKLTENAADILLGEVVNCFGPVVESGHGGHDDGAGIVGPQHVLKMDAIEGSLADAEDERAAFLEADVSGAGEQIFGEAVSDFGEGSGGTRDDGHAIDRSGAGGDGCAYVFIGKVGDFCSAGLGEERGESFEVLDDDVELGREKALASFADDEKNLGDARVGVEMLEDGAGVESAAGSGDADGNGAAARGRRRDGAALRVSLGHGEFFTLGRRFEQSQGRDSALGSEKQKLKGEVNSNSRFLTLGAHLYAVNLLMKRTLRFVCASSRTRRRSVWNDTSS
jgi:hypothetical protein